MSSAGTVAQPKKKKEEEHQRHVMNLSADFLKFLLHAFVGKLNIRLSRRGKEITFVFYFTIFWKITILTVLC